MTTLTAEYPDHLNAHERDIIDHLVRDALALGCTISIHDGEEYPVKRSRDYNEITRHIAATDETTLRIRDGELHAAVFLVHGNAPHEVICDHTDTPWARSIIAGADRAAAKLEAMGY